MDKVSWDEAKSFLKYKAASVVLKRLKTSFFNHQEDDRRRLRRRRRHRRRRHRRRHRTTSQGAKPLPAAYIHKALAKI